MDEIKKSEKPLANVKTAFNEPIVLGFFGVIGVVIVGVAGAISRGMNQSFRN